MKLDQLRDAVAIADHGGMRPAALHLGVPQPGLTRNLHNLEQELGIQIFERGRRGMTATELGKIVIERARGILAEVQALSDSMLAAADKQDAGASAPAFSDPAARPEEIYGEFVLETFRLNGKLLATGDRFLKPIKLTASRWQILGAVERNHATVSEIAAYMGLRRQSVQRTTNLLLSEGLMNFVDNPRHRRSKIATLTPAGEAAVHEASKYRRRQWVTKLSSGISTSEVDAVRRLMRRIGELIEED